jgi:ankyrin repeat protein
MSYVLALLQIGGNESLTIQDNQGRTPYQLLTCRAPTEDENQRLPLHCLAASSDNLCPKSLQLLADAYPASIKSVDKYGMLPFHHACKNPASSVEVLMLLLNCLLM